MDAGARSSRELNCRRTCPPQEPPLPSGGPFPPLESQFALTTRLLPRPPVCATIAGCAMWAEKEWLSPVREGQRVSEPALEEHKIVKVGGNSLTRAHFDEGAHTLRPASGRSLGLDVPVDPRLSPCSVP